jgi:hypothetical protein
MHAIVILYGLPRSLVWTHHSINRNAIGPLEALADKVTRVAHFNAPTVIHNPHSRERGMRFNQPDYSLLDPDRLMVVRQDNAAITDLLERFRTHDIRARGIESHIALLHALRSLEAAYALAQDVPGPPGDIFLFLRPDLEYIDPWPAADLVPRLLSGEIDLACPSWHSFGGLNDRYAVANRKGAAVYASRLGLLDEVIALGEPRNSEEILKYAADKAGLKVGEFDSRAFRVRTDGLTMTEDADLSITHRISNRLRWELGKRGIRGPRIALG